MIICTNAPGSLAHSCFQEASNSAFQKTFASLPPFGPKEGGKAFRSNAARTGWVSFPDREIQAQGVQKTGTNRLHDARFPHARLLFEQSCDAES